MPKQSSYAPGPHWQRKADQFRMAVLAALEEAYEANEVKGSFQFVGEVHRKAAKKCGLTVHQVAKLDPNLEPGLHPLWCLNGKRYVRVGVWRELQQAFTYGMAFAGHRGLPKDKPLESLDWSKYEAANPDLWKPWTDIDLAKVYGIGQTAAKKMRLYETFEKGGESLGAHHPLPKVARPLFPHGTKPNDPICRHLHPSTYDIAPDPKAFRARGGSRKLKAQVQGGDPAFGGDATPYKDN